jgi:hypothetical protein
MEYNVLGSGRVDGNKGSQVSKTVAPVRARGIGYCNRRTSISGTKKAQITFPLRHFFPLKVVK